MADLKSEIRKLALQNAIKYEGKASPGAVIGGLISSNPEVKKDLKKIGKEISKIVAEVNKLSLEKQRKELEGIDPELLKEKKKEKRTGLPDLKNAVKGKVIMRIEPSPSGPLHIGHAYVVGLNAEYVKRYKGRFIVRIGDTNPENIYEPAYKMIPEEIEWLTKNNVYKVVLQSDRLRHYYKNMEKLIDLEKVYICECDPEEFKKKIRKSEACPCRELGKDEQKQRWKKMFKEYKQGEVVARLKTDINDKNPAMRDFPLFRINDTEHPKVGKKYRVWPLMNMAVAVDDSEMGITHVIRAKDHADNAKRQKIIHDYLVQKTPEALFVGKINFEGMPLSSSKTREEIKKGNYSGWDDIRLGFLAALRKRGYQPDAFVKYAVSVGISLTDKKVAKEEFFKQLNHFNKEVVDPVSNRYFFVWNPKKIRVEGAPEQKIELDLHPDNKKGGRVFKTAERFYVCDEDLKGFKKGKMYRLMDCLNFRFEGKDKILFDSDKYERFKEGGEKIIHWLPIDDGLVDAEVVMPDTKVIKGLGEESLKKIKEGDVVQLERFGFCRLVEKKKNKFRFWYGHK